MRHGKKDNHLGRTTSHRKALLSNMASSLILHKRITTTLAKAKELRKYVEPLLTKSKNNTMHSRRVVFSYLQNKESIKELFDNVADKILDRPGGYTRIIRLGNRLGDNAEICMMELVDFNTTMVKEDTTKTKTRRSRRGKKSGSDSDTTQKVESKEEVKAEKPAKAEKKVEKEEETKEDKAEE